MRLLARLLCWLTWHDWEYSTRDNHLVLLRHCTCCGKRQRRASGDSIAPTEYWQDARA